HHEERRQDEGDTHQRRPGHAGAHPSEVDRELRRERPRRELREGEPLDVVLPRDPAALVDEVALHVADERDRSAEPECAEAEEVAEQLAEAARRPRGRQRRGRWEDGHGLSPSGATVRPSNSVTESAFVHSPTLPGSAKVWSCASTTFSSALHALARNVVSPSGPLSSEVLVEVVEDSRPSGQPILVVPVPHADPADQAINPRRCRPSAILSKPRCARASRLATSPSAASRPGAPKKSRALTSASRRLSRATSASSCGRRPSGSASPDGRLSATRRASATIPPYSASRAALKSASTWSSRNPSTKRASQSDASPPCLMISRRTHSKSSRAWSVLGRTYAEFLIATAPSAWSRRHIFTRK